MVSDRPVRLVGVRYLNARPLIAGLQAGIVAPFSYSFSTADPSVCGDELTAGEHVAGLVPVVAVARLGAGVAVVGGLGVTCRGAVDSVLLVSKVALAEIKTLAVHSASRTSVILAQLVLIERYGARPQVEIATPPLEDMLANADAAVVIGDPALALHGRTGLIEVDLGAAWWEWTGLPFVFAVWAVGDHPPEGLARLLGSSLDYAREHWEKLIPVWAHAHGVEATVVRNYLEHRLHYQLGVEERKGLEEFLRRSATAGLLPTVSLTWENGPVDG